MNQVVGNQNYHTAFFAYPSEPRDRAVIIEKAVQLVNTDSKDLKIISWTNMNKSSSRVITNIFESIGTAEVFIADISGLNPNVLFETGYAFGSGKNILLFVQGLSASERRRDMDDMNIITGINIESYENAVQLASKIVSSTPGIFEYTPEIFKYAVSTKPRTTDKTRGLFLKGITNYDLSLAALNSFRDIFPHTVVDDWNEYGAQNLTWYIDQIVKASGVTALFVADSWDSSRKINARFSFICGLALALRKNLLLIGLPGYNTPFDYKEIMSWPASTKLMDDFVKQCFATDNSSPTITNKADSKSPSRRNSDTRISEVNPGSGSSQAPARLRKAPGEKEDSNATCINVNGDMVVRGTQNKNIRGKNINIVNN